MSSYKRPAQGREDVYRPVTDEACLTALYVGWRAQEQIAAIREMAASAEDREVIDKLLDSAAARVRAKEERAAAAAPQRVRSSEVSSVRAALLSWCVSCTASSQPPTDRPCMGGTGRSRDRPLQGAVVHAACYSRGTQSTHCDQLLCMLCVPDLRVTWQPGWAARRAAARGRRRSCSARHSPQTTRRRCRGAAAQPAAAPARAAAACARAGACACAAP